MTLLSRARAASLFSALFGALLLAGCEDPSAVGLTVLDVGDATPETITVPADEATLAPLTDPTGFTRPTGGGVFTARTLAGRAEDPLFGTVTASGHLDFFRPVELPAGFLTSPIERVVLELRPDYRFGDTTATATFDVYEIAAEWVAGLLPSDTTLAVHDRLLATFSVSGADTLAHVELPADWVAERDTLFRGETFATDFHGLQIRPRQESRLAFGFSQESSLLMISDLQEEAPRDTVVHPVASLFSSIQRDLHGTVPPPDLVPLQDGTGQGLHASFRLDELGSPAVTAAFIRVQADTTLLERDLPPNFARPLARTLALYALGDGLPTLIAEARLDRRQQAYVFTSEGLSRLFQDAVLGRPARIPGFRGFAVGFPRSPSTLNVAPVIANPEAILLVVPTDL